MLIVVDMSCCIWVVVFCDLKEVGQEGLIVIVGVSDDDVGDVCDNDVVFMNCVVGDDWVGCEFVILNQEFDECKDFDDDEYNGRRFFLVVCVVLIGNGYWKKGYSKVFDQEKGIDNV